MAWRSRGRLPVLTWKHPETNAAIFRCSQPRVGFAGARCLEDERLLAALAATREPSVACVRRALGLEAA
jgi:hypothetical protein